MVEVSVAVFDVDKTLTVRDCVVPFVLKVAGRARVAMVVLKHLPTVITLMRRRDRDGIKVFFVRQLFSGRSVEDVEAIGTSFAAMVANHWMRSDVAQRFRWHQSEGHVVVLVSASLDAYLMTFGDLIEADAVICTTLEEKDGVYTGELVGANCRGIEKVSRIRQWCDESGFSADSIHFAYGDSRGDEPMIHMARTGVWVGKNDLEVMPA